MMQLVGCGSETIFYCFDEAAALTIFELQWPFHIDGVKQK
jgi:hypothetical protein